MATKTLTITTDAYQLLAENKLERESFSMEIKRIFSLRKAKTLKDFFGILPDHYAQGMRTDLQKIKAFNIKQLKEKLRHESS